MLWAETMEDVLAGRLTPYDHEVDVATGEPISRGVFDMQAYGIGHISVPNIRVDDKQKRFIMHFHGFDKGQFADLPESVIGSAGGLNQLGNHASFVATSPFGINFNDLS